MNIVSISHKSGAPIEHAMIINNFIAEIRGKIKNKNCRVFADSMEYILAENDNIPFVPDASINCNIKARKDDAFTEAPRFVLIIKGIDCNKKIEWCTKISVPEWWVVDWQKKEVQIYFDGKLRCTVVSDNKEDLCLMSMPEIQIAFDDLFNME